LRQRLNDSGDKQVSGVDVDVRLPAKRGGTTGGFNVQIAVDSKLALFGVGRLWDYCFQHQGNGAKNLEYA
jgi:hypothetical protein